MTALRATVRGYVADVARGFDRAPVEMALAVYIAVTFSIALEIGEEPLPWLETAAAALLVFAAAWTGTLLHALGSWSTRVRHGFTLAVTLVVAVWAWLVLDFSREAEVWRTVGLLAAAVLWLVAVPAFGARVDAVARMRRVDGRILLRTIAVLLYAAALFAGLALALAAVDTLFELDFEGRIYGHVFGAIFMVLVPWVVVGGLEDYVRMDAGPEPVASAVHRLTYYLVPPLLAIYFLILYAYMVRIGITGEVPKNLVSPMVLAACAITAIALLLFDPKPAGAAFARTLRLAPVLLLPLAPLGAWALITRVDQYGWTEFRALRLVVLGAFTGLAILATVQLVRRRPFALHVLPLALAAATLLAVIGPWGVLPLSRRSQQARLQQALAEVERVAVSVQRHEGNMRMVPAHLYERVLNDARYLQGHFGPASLPPQLARHARGGNVWVDYAAALRLERIPGTRDGEQRIYAARLGAGQPVRLSRGTLYRIEFTPERGRPPAQPIAIAADSLRLVLHLPEGVVYADVAPLMTTNVRARQFASEDVRAVVPVTDAAGNVRGELVVFDASAQVEKGGRVLQYLNGAVLMTGTAGAGAPSALR